MWVFYLFLFIAAGLLFDWALYGRIVMILCQPAFYGRGDGYAEQLFPRIIATIASVVMLFFAVQGQSTNFALLAIGVAMFVSSNVYAVSRFMRHN